MERLLQRTDATDIAALVRGPGKAAELEAGGVSIRRGDYDDTQALEKAMVGVDRVLLIAGTDPDQRVQQHQNVIDAARRADVELLGFASRSLRDIHGSQNSLMGDYFETEDRIRRSGVPHALFRNALYLDTLPLFVGGSRVFDTGIRLPVGDGRVAFALRREMGEALANAMIDIPRDHPPEDRSYVFAAPQAYSFDDIAAALTEASGRSVTYTPVTEEEWLVGARQAGLPEPVARRSVGFYSDVRDHQLDETSADLQAFLGRRPAPLTEGVSELFDL